MKTEKHRVGRAREILIYYISTIFNARIWIVVAIAIVVDVFIPINPMRLQGYTDVICKTKSVIRREVHIRGLFRDIRALLVLKLIRIWKWELIQIKLIQIMRNTFTHIEDIQYFRYFDAYKVRFKRNRNIL